MKNLSAAELKNDLHRLIVETKDIEFLEGIHTAFVNFHGGEKSTDWWDLLPESAKRSVERGIQQLENGKGIPHAEVRKEIDEMFARAKAAQKK